MKNNILAVVIIVGFISIAFLITATKNGGQGIGSVVQGSEYNATTSIATSAGTHWLAKSTTNAGVCVLGSIIVASSSDTTFTLWNATSTTDIASTTIVAMVADIAVGTYQYDITCSRGLVVETPASFDGQYTTTYR